jgi:4-amino-4-deoxy-L-arabinose transferase-like glycosyltransferase
MNKKTLFTIIAVVFILLTAVYYFIALKAVPGGVFPDAAANGLDANQILDGVHQPFFERGNGREALFFYLMAGAMLLFGVNHWAILIPGITIAILTIFGIYLLGKELFNRKVGLASMMIAAPSYWLFIISRSGFRAILVPFFLVFFFYFLFLAIKKSEKVGLYAALSGLSFGLGFYSYISYRMVFAWLAFFVILLIISKISDRKDYKKYAKISWWFGIFSIIPVLPLIWYFVGNPEAIVGRAGQVSVFNPEFNQGDLIGTIYEQFKKNFLSFWLEGDSNWRHNISTWPLFDSVTGILLTGGFIFFLIRSVQFFINLFKRISFQSIEYLIIFVSFWFMMVPGIMSGEGTPHGLRIIGSFPFAVIMAGWFLIAIYGFLSSKDKDGKWIVGRVVVITVLVYILLFNTVSFWLVAAQSPDYYYAFRKDLTPVSQYINQRNDRENTYLALDEFSLQTTEFLTSEYDQPYQKMALDKIDLLKLEPGQQVIFTVSTFHLIDQFEAAHPQARLIKKEFNETSYQHEELMRVYEY